jgi:catechol 2,3-dioxygenase-like lactoylglutathione lyase family enzyme
VIALDHINIRVDDQEAVRDFLIELLGLVDGPRPDFDFKGYWLYLGDKPVIHIMGRSGNSSAGDGWADHIAFSGFEFDKEIRRMDRMGRSYWTSGIPGGPRQIFVTGPEGVKIELQCDA